MAITTSVLGSILERIGQLYHGILREVELGTLEQQEGNLGAFLMGAVNWQRVWINNSMNFWL
jgi:hypothetical protein